MSILRSEWSRWRLKMGDEKVKRYQGMFFDTFSLTFLVISSVLFLFLSFYPLCLYVWYRHKSFFLLSLSRSKIQSLPLHSPHTYTWYLFDTLDNLLPLFRFQSLESNLREGKSVPSQIQAFLSVTNIVDDLYFSYSLLQLLHLLLSLPFISCHTIYYLYLYH